MNRHQWEWTGGVSASNIAGHEVYENYHCIKCGCDVWLKDGDRLEVGGCIGEYVYEVYVEGGRGWCSTSEKDYNEWRKTSNVKGARMLKIMKEEWK